MLGLFDTEIVGTKMKRENSEQVPIESIHVGTRFRKDMGNIEALASSIQSVGLLHPIAVTPSLDLIAGCRRLKACKSLQWATIPVHIVDIAEIARGEFHENVVRKDFLPSEAVAIAKALEEGEREKARERLAVRSENFSEVKPDDKGRALDKVGIAVGMSRPTLEKAKAVVEAAEEEPEKYGHLVEQMDKTGKVDGAYKELRRARTRDEYGSISSDVNGTNHTDITISSIRNGDWWHLGRHSLYCGDTSSKSFIDKLPIAAFSFADPPYGAEVADWDNAFYWEHDYLINKAPIVAVTPGIMSIFEFARKTAMPYSWSLACWIDNGMTRGALGFGNWIYTALFSRESIYRQSQDFFRVSIDNMDNDATVHKGRKPSGYMAHMLNIFTSDGEVVIDPFLGSGTTLLVAERMNRTCIGGEIDPTHCAEIISRFQSLTGQVAYRE